MTSKQQIPSRAEYIRDRLAEWCDGYGHECTAYSVSGAACLTVESIDFVADVEVATSGAMRDQISGDPLRMPGFSWVAESADTGMIHGPRLESGALDSTCHGIAWEGDAISKARARRADPNDRYSMVDVRRWAFYNIGAMMRHRDTGAVHGPHR